MKKIILIASVILIVCAISMCKKKKNEPEPPPDDGAVPPVTNTRVTPLPGGLFIKYDIPKDKGIKQVTAKYTLDVDEKPREEIDATAKGNMSILGYASTTEKTVELYSEDKSGKKSIAVKVKGTPKISPIKRVEQSMEIKPAIFGAKYTWTNQYKKGMIIKFIANDTNPPHRLKVQHTIHSDKEENQYILEGYSGDEGKKYPFAALIRDDYNNVSDSIWPKEGHLITPISKPDVRLDKKRFRRIQFANDTNWDGKINDDYVSSYCNFFDDDTSTYIFTGRGINPRTGAIYSVDLGVRAKITKIVIHYSSFGKKLLRTDYFTGPNIKACSVYGSLDKNIGEDLDSWYQLKEEHYFSKPSLQEERERILTNGDTIVIDNKVEIRYLRIHVNKLWWNHPLVFMTSSAEMTVFGKVVEEINDPGECE